VVFSSVIFIFYFLPVFLLGYYVSGWRAGALLTGSAVFYVWGEGAYVVLLLGLIGLNYAGSRWLDATDDRRRRFAILAALAIADFAVLDERVPQRKLGLDLVAVSTAVSLAQHVALLDELGEDLVGAPLGDADASSDLAEPDA